MGPGCMELRLYDRPFEPTVFGGQPYFKDKAAAVKLNSASQFRNHLGFSTLQLLKIP
jgi:hypothetical protein